MRLKFIIGGESQFLNLKTLHGLHASKFIESGTYNKVIVVGCDKMSRAWFCSQGFGYRANALASFSFIETRL
ncbi:MAG: hypothetical protein ACJ0PT_02060 [Flavobacteriales bacterium]